MERKGVVARQTHVGIPVGLVEEEHGRGAFAGASSHLYRTAPPTAWIAVEGPLQPVALDAGAVAGDVVPIAANEDVRLSVDRRRVPDAAAERDGDADAVVFIHRGQGVLQTDYGPLDYADGDYLVLPRGTTHRWVPDGGESLRYVVAITSAVSLPDFGLLGRHAVVDPKVVTTPEPWSSPPADFAGEQGRWRVRARRRGRETVFVYPHNPFNAVGWAGDLAPWRLHTRDIRPVVAPGFHLPPSVHTTFRGRGVDVATFVPRPFESDPESLRVPFFHANVDNDEVIFYSRGEFFSRRGIGEGWLTLHPAGTPHGPQPGAAERAAERERAEELAVMVECRQPLELSPAAQAAADPAYATSWARGLGLAP